MINQSKWVIENREKLHIGSPSLDQPRSSDTVVHEGTFDIIARKLHDMQVGNSAAQTAVKIRSLNQGNTDRIIVCHNETDFGVLNFKHETKEYQCHACGKWAADLKKHVFDTHGMSLLDYMRDYNIADFLQNND